MATIQVPIQLRRPDPVNPGNAFLSVLDGTVHKDVVPAFLKDVDGSWYGLVRVPQDYVQLPKVVLAIAANATAGITRLQISSSRVPNTGQYNPASYTVETAQDITVPATAYLRADVTFNLTTPGIAAGDDLELKITHLGAHANDTLAVNTLLLNSFLQYSNL